MTNTNISQYQIEKISSKNIITKKLKETSDDFSYDKSSDVSFSFFVIMFLDDIFSI